MKIVIIGQDEQDSMPRMLDALKNVDAQRIWVCDRCSDGSEAYLLSQGEKFICTPKNLMGRQTSYSRNLGLSVVGEDDVLFLDGDRFPVEGDLGDLCNSKTDVTLLNLENDFRLDYNVEKNYEKYYGKVYNFFYSCGIFMKKDAIKKVCDFQGGELFSTEVQAQWGIEDTYLGDVCYSLGLTCSFHPDIRLRGAFEKRYLDSSETMKIRFALRDKLEGILWK